MIIGLGFTSLWFHDSYKSSQAKLKEVQAENIELKEIIEANDHNTDEELTKVSNEFITMMFKSPASDVKKHQKEMLSLTIGKASNGLRESINQPVTGEMESLEGFISDVKIINSFYNRIDDTKGSVKVQFEQELSKDGSASKTLNEAVLKLEYVKDEWKIYEYQIIPLL